MTAAGRDWLDGKAAAVVFNIAFEGWEEGSPSRIGPMGNPLPPDVYDGQAASWGDYGMREGIWRLLDVFARHGVRTTTMTNGILAERAPGAVEALRDAGHDVCGHGYAQNILNPLLDPERERELMLESRDLLAGILGAPPRGWVSPRCTPSRATIGLLAEAGFEWHSDCFDSDLPHDEAEGILAIPFDMTLNDLPFHIRFGNPPFAYVELFERTLDAVVREGTGGIVDVTAHTHVFGRPPGAAAIDEILTRARRRDDIAVMTRSEIHDTWTKKGENDPSR